MLLLVTVIFSMACLSQQHIDTRSIKNGSVLPIGLDSLSDGKLIIEIPRVLVDSPQVLLDGTHVPAQESTTNSKVRTLVVNFHKDSSRIEIQDKTPAKVASSFRSALNTGSTVNNSANNNTSSGSQINTILTYRSAKYGIRSIQYPSDWTYETDPHPNNSPTADIF